MNKFTIAILLFCSAVVSHAQMMVEETVFDRPANEETFAFGADISWLSQQESWGTKYRNRQGKQTDLMKILKEDFNLNALRFRVWVNPAGGWSGKQDVINLCKRAHAMGFKIMISFHYSDTWADSGSQTIPAQWTDHSADALARNVYEHTKDVLSGLKSEGIIPKWVSIGNETKYGMLYETGRTKTTEGYQNFVKFINAGARAVKEIDPGIMTIIHLPNAHDESTARNMFTNLDKYGANYDAIGLSAYPRWSHLDITNDSQIASTINTYMTTFKNLKAKFNKPVIVMETGHYVDQPYDANRFLSEFMKALIADGELGCFYWEPEASSGYNLGAWDGVTQQATIAMDAYRGVKFTKVDKYFSAVVMSPKEANIYAIGEPIELKISARTSTDITAMEKIECYMNKSVVATFTPDMAKMNLYNISVNNLETGKYGFYAKLTDNQGHEQLTDTFNILVGNIAVFQENDNSIDLSEYPGMTVSKTVRGYTGSGYIPTTDDNANKVSWNIRFPEPGVYNIFVRYNSGGRKNLRALYDDQSSIVLCSPTNSSKWAYGNAKLTISEAGVHNVKLQGFVNAGLPNIDYIAIASPDGAPVVEGALADGINDLAFNSHVLSSQAVYDLQGRLVAGNINNFNLYDSLKPGVYITGGRKIVIR